MRRVVIAALVVLGMAGWAGADVAERGVAELLAETVEEFSGDPAADGPFGVVGIRVVDEGSWHAVRGGDGWVLREGPPDGPALGYVVDEATLRTIIRGEMSALTAGGRASMSDPAPFDLEMLGGFAPSPEQTAELLPFTFHFWTVGSPEVVPFGREHSRVVHGANASVLYYQPGLRTAWYGIERDQHVNRDPEDQTNPFPSLCVFIAGRTTARIGGETVQLERGEAVLIPAGTAHEFWNEQAELAEMIIIMFGEGA